VGFGAHASGLLHSLFNDRGLRVSVFDRSLLSGYVGLTIFGSRLISCAKVVRDVVGEIERAKWNKVEPDCSLECLKHTVDYSSNLVNHSSVPEANIDVLWLFQRLKFNFSARCSRCSIDELLRSSFIIKQRVRYILISLIHFQQSVTSGLVSSISRRGGLNGENVTEFNLIAILCFHLSVRDKIFQGLSA